MKILFLTFYYPPDLCAGSFRSGALIKALQDNSPSDLEIQIITTLPNRYYENNVKAPIIENFKNLQILRIPTRSHNSSMIGQTLAFLQYAFGVIRFVKNKEYDLVFATSSRLMTSVLAAEIAIRSKKPLYLDIRDLFTDTMKNLLGRKYLPFYLPLKYLETRTFKYASKINIVSQGFSKYLNSYKLKNDLAFFTNGIDNQFLNPEIKKVSKFPREIEILYAGNIGSGQGLEHILPQMASLTDKNIKYRIIGGGGRKNTLVKNVNKKMSNIQICPPISRSKLLDAYEKADILFIHLNAYPAFEKVLPSKIFEYAATGKPILAGVSGYSADFIRNNLKGVEVFKPCDALSAIDALEKIMSGPSYYNRLKFCEEFSRENIMKSMSYDILRVVYPKGFNL